MLAPVVGVQAADTPPIPQAVIDRSPGDAELLRHIPADVGYCLVVDRWETLAEQWQAGPLSQRLPLWPVYQQWLGTEDARQLQRVLDIVADRLEQPLPEFLSEATAGGIALAAIPNGRDEPSILLLASSGHERAIRKFLTQWNREDSAELTELTLKGVAYQKRTIPRSESTVHYYARLGNIFAVSDSEAALQQVLVLHEKSLADSLTGTRGYQRVLEEFTGKPPVVAYINPRSWDELIERPEDPNPVQGWLIDFWDNCHAVGLGMQFQQGVTCEVIALTSPLAQPSAGQVTDGDDSPPKSGVSDAVSSPPPATAFLQHVPADALVVLTGRLQITELGDWVEAQIPEQDRRQWQTMRQLARGFLLGQDLFDDVLTQAGPEWGFYLQPAALAAGDENNTDAESTIATALPMDGLLAIEFHRPAASRDERTAVQNSLRNALGNGWNVAAALLGGQQKRRAVVHTEKITSKDNVETRLGWIDALGPALPAYAVTDEYLLIATRPELIRSFIAGPPKKSLSTSTRFQDLATRWFPDPHQLGFVDIAGLRRFIATRRSRFAEDAVLKQQLTTAEADSRIQKLLDALELLDGVFFAADVTPERVRVIFGADLIPATTTP